ncbi:MAG: hypothetical protein EXR71_04615 [Myxococcales bacterium]|nr:hypothetical protein [Myxococcales bacterium]
MILWVSVALAVCPTPDTDPPVCPAGSVNGTSIDHPYEWGAAAAGLQPWWGRLACAGGRIPVFRRHGGVGAPSVVSAAPRSAAARVGTSELVDAWEVGCPEARYELYTSVYRCAEVCLPAVLSVVPARAMRHLEAARSAARAGDVAGALAAGQAATDSAPEHERTWVLRGSFAEDLGRFDEALVAWNGAVARFPGSLSEGHRAEALARTGKKAEAKELSARLLAAAPDAPGRARLLCVQSLADDDPAARATLARQSCAEGYQRCCTR